MVLIFVANVGKFTVPYMDAMGTCIYIYIYSQYIHYTLCFFIHIIYIYIYPPLKLIDFCSTTCSYKKIRGWKRQFDVEVFFPTCFSLECYLSIYIYIYYIYRHFMYMLYSFVGVHPDESVNLSKSSLSTCSRVVIRRVALTEESNIF